MRLSPALQRTFICLFLGIVCVFVERGFFYPDPYFLALDPHGFHQASLWSMRIVVPLLYVYGCFLIFQVFSKKLTKKVAVCAYAAIFVLLGGVYVAALAGRDVLQASRTPQIHPYLQLPPKVYPEPHTHDTTHTSVYFLGGSTTEFADSHGATWTSRVERLLSPFNVRCYNAGKQWYTSLHSLIYHLTHLQQHPPHTLVVMHTINDVLHNADFSYFSAGPFQADYGHFYGPLSDKIQRASLLKNTVHALKSMWYHTPRKVVTQDVFPGLASYENNLRTLIDTAQQKGSKVVLMTEAHLYKPHMTQQEKDALYMLNVEAVGPTQQWDLTTAMKAMRTYNNVVRSLAKEKGLVLIDLEKTIPPSLEYFYDDVHFQDKAFDLVAKTVASSLQTFLPRATHAAHTP